MKKIFYFTIALASLFALQSCQAPLTPEDASRAILEGERERIPLYIQEFELKDLTIDSLRMLIPIEPMSGLLYTTWTYEHTLSYYESYERKEKKTIKTQPLIIQVTNIERSKDGRLIQWISDWDLVNFKIERSDYKL